jgi:hypothetical protein
MDNDDGVGGRGGDGWGGAGTGFESRGDRLALEKRWGRRNDKVGASMGDFRFKVGKFKRGQV